MDYRYDTHCHSADCSACARTSAREMVHKYKEAGFSGFVLTDHFIFGNSAVDKTLPWEQRMRCYYDAYLSAKEEGDKIDFDVIFGIEHAYGDGKEVLCYGIDLDFLISNPDIPTISFDEFVKRVHDAGGIVVQAHPYRERNYINMAVEPRIDLIDGVEVYNGANDGATNLRAYELAKANNFIFTSGSDFHGWPGETAGKAGVIFDKRIKNATQFVEELRKKKHEFVVDFEPITEINEKIF